MAIKDVSEVLRKAINGVVDEETGKKIPVVADDLSNLVEIGQALSETEKIAVLGEMCDVITKQSFYAENYIDTSPNISKAEDSFNAICQVNRVSLPNSDFDKNMKYSGMMNNNAITFNDMYGDHFPTVASKYYSNVVTDSFTVTYTEDQFKQAFMSPAAMSNYVSAVQSAVATRRKSRGAYFNYATFACAIADTAKATPNRVIEISDDTHTTIIKQIRHAIRQMRKYNDKYSTFATSEDKENLTLYISADLYDELQADDRAAFNPQIFGLPDMSIEVRPDWYYNADMDTHAKDIICKCHETTPDTEDTFYATVIPNIQWVLVSNRFMGTTRRNDEAIAIENKLGHRTNIAYQSEYEARINSDFPILICVKDKDYITDVDTNSESFEW